MFVLGVVSMVLAHELSHTIVARAVGDPTASVPSPERQANGGFCIGCKTMDLARISAPALALVSVAGVAVTTTIAFLLGRVSRRRGPVSLAPIAWA